MLYPFFQIELPLTEVKKRKRFSCRKKADTLPQSAEEGKKLPAALSAKRVYG
jgi:hypothetical protein